MPVLGVTTTTTLAIPLGVLAVAEDLRAALLTLGSVQVDGVDGTRGVYTQDADYRDQPGVPMPYRAVERALLTVLAEATGSASHAGHIVDEAGRRGEGVRDVIEGVLGWQVVVTDGAGNPLPAEEEPGPDGRGPDGGAGAERPDAPSPSADDAPTAPLSLNSPLGRVDWGGFRRTG